MKFKQRIAAAAAAFALLVGGAFGAAALAGPAVAAPDGPAVYAQLDRVGATTAATGANGSYSNLTNNTSKWSALNEAGGFTFDTNGIHIPVTGVYHISWNAILTAGGSGICGFALNGDTPNGGVLFGIGPIVNLAAAVGNGSADVVLADDSTVNFWCYGNGGSITLQTVKASNIDITLIDEL